MNIRDLILNEGELFQLFRKVLEGLISLNDLNESHISQLRKFAQHSQFQATRQIDQILQINPQYTFEEIAARHGNYKDANRVLEWLDTVPKEKHKSEKTKTEKPLLNMNQIALKYVYEGLQITRENGNEIAKKYGHNSGEKLFQRFTYYSSTSNRKGKPNSCTSKKLRNKIELIESVIELMPTDKRDRATDEVSILKKLYEVEYQ